MRHLVALAAAILIILGGLAFAAGTCSDGTAYGKCSSANPGSYCTGTLDSPALGVTLLVCPCDKFPGYIQEGEGDNAVCVLSKCTDGTEGGKCSTTKPKQCVAGALVDNATKCGCPDGKRVSANGMTCEFIPCNDSGLTVPEGLCSGNKPNKCVGGKLVEKASECGCPVGKTKSGEGCVLLCDDGTNDAECSSTKPKECVNGYLIDNAQKCGCPTGTNAVGKQCSANVIDALGGSDLLGGTPAGNASSGTGAAGGANALSCCCLPTALIGLIGGFAFFRKK